MENSKNDWKAIRNGILSALISSIILLVLNSSIYWFQKEKMNISISSSTYIDNQYVTSISVKNYQKNKSVSEINLWIKDSNINNLESDLNIEQNDLINNIKVKDVMPLYNGTIIIYSDKIIDEKNISIETNEKTNIIFLKEQKESAYINIRQYFIVIFIYFIEMSIVYIINNKKINVEKEKNKKEILRIEDKMLNIEKRSAQMQKERMNNRLILQKRLSAYAKELDFWKNTIRRLLYKSKNSKIHDKDIFEIVTNELKTYKTLDKCDYKNLEEVIEEIKEIEE